MQAILEILSESYMQRAMLASAIVGLSCGLLGCFIVLRRMALIGDALSHAILPGVVVAYALAGFSLLAFFTGAVISGFITALLITWVHRNSKTQEDSAVGIIFTFMFALGVIGITEINKQGVHLDVKDFLFGSVFGVGLEDLSLVGTIAATICISIPLFYRQLFLSTLQPKTASTMGVKVELVHYFLMIILSLTIVSALQTVGVILVVAMLIIPASTAYIITNRLKYMLFISAGVGVLSTLLGMFVAIVFDSSPGPCMTICASMCYGLAFCFAPEKGLISKYRIRNQQQFKIKLEDCMKRIARLQESGIVTIADLESQLPLNTTQLRRLISKLQRKGLLQVQKTAISLTNSGTEFAYSIIRAHRLWETYMQEHAGLNADQVHVPADTYEHTSSSNMIDTLDARLGFPSHDPHGNPIPRKIESTTIHLQNLPAESAAYIAFTQIDTRILRELVNLNIHPTTKIKAILILDGKCWVQTDTQKIEIPLSFANRIQINLVKA